MREIALIIAGVVFLVLVQKLFRYLWLRIKVRSYTNSEKYQQYMKSKRWRDLKVAVKKRDNNKCFVCNSKKNLECHHLNYPKDINDTKMYSCIMLCEKHHRQIHRKMVNNYANKNK